MKKTFHQWNRWLEWLHLNTKTATHINTNVLINVFFLNKSRPIKPNLSYRPTKCRDKRNMNQTRKQRIAGESACTRHVFRHLKIRVLTWRVIKTGQRDAIYENNVWSIFEKIHHLRNFYVIYVLISLFSSLRSEIIQLVKNVNEVAIIRMYAVFLIERKRDIYT